MNNNNQQPMGKGIIAVIAGMLAGIIAFGLLFFIWSLYDYTSGRHEQGTFESPYRAAILIPVFAGSLLSGFVTARMASQRLLTYAAISGIGLVILWLICFYSLPTIIIACLFFPFALAGGWLAIRYKLKKKKNP